MKKNLLFVVMMCLLCLNLFSAQQKKTIDPDPKNQVKQVVSKEITYPDFAVDLGIEGTVYASFQLTENGKLNVIQIESTNEQLKNYVSEKLKKIRIELKKSDDSKDLVFNMKFSFELL